MKQTTILWFSAIIITLLAGYYFKNSIPDHPVMGSTGLEGKRVYYLLNTSTSPSNKYDVIIKSALPCLSGFVEWRNASDPDTVVNSIPLSEGSNLLSAKLPNLAPGERIIYRIILNRDNKTIALPASSFVTAHATGIVPSAVRFSFFITLVCGFVLSARTGLEFFKGNSNAKKLALVTAGFFFINAVILTPLKKVFEAGLQLKGVLDFTNYFSLNSFLVFIGWGIALFAIKKFPRFRLSTIIMSVISFILFIIIHY